MRGNSKANLVAAVIFCLVLFLPLLGKEVPSINFDPEIEELRNLNEPPSFSLKDVANFSNQYESFFNDHFGFRNWLIQLNNRFRLNIFGVSGSPKVLAGKDGWLYYTGNQVIDDYRGVNKFTNEDLKQWQTVIEKKQRWLASQGIEYLFLVAPNKASIYPEYLPDGIVRVGNSGPLDQLVAHLNQYSTVKILDLRETLRTQKKEGLLFFRTDTHWSFLGAFFAYEQIASQLVSNFPQVKKISRDELNIDIQLRNGGDLATMLGMQRTLKEEVSQISLLNTRSTKIMEVSDSFIMETPDQQLPRAVMFRDSFTTALVPYLSENFSHIKYIWKRWNNATPMEQIILETQPDIVIEEVVERYVKGMTDVTISPQIESFFYSKSIFKFGENHDGAIDFKPLHQVNLDVRKSKVFVNSTGNDPNFLLPEINFTAGSNLLLSFDFTSPEDSMFQIFYQTEKRPFFNEEDSYRVKTKKGRNKISIPVLEKQIIGKIRVDPGSFPGEYIFKSIEVNASS
jgi:hypothetical protein